MAPRLVSIVLAVLVIVISMSIATPAEDARFKIIVNAKNPVTNLDSDQLRNMFLKKRVVWGNGDTIRPIDLSSKFPVREQFVRRVLKKTPAQLKTYWNQQIFSGKGVPPPEASSPADVINYVRANSGAVGYVPADTDARDAKVVEVK
jgi:ABC-type phosphate transport system substrate-binding protein